MNLNKVFLIGRLTRDPETRSTPSGQTVTTLGLATNRVWSDASGRKEATEFHTVVAWGRLGEIASNYLKKGGLVLIEGRLQTRSWTGKDNVKRYSTEIVAENLQLGPRSAGGGSYESSSPARRSSAPAAAPIDNDIPIIDENEPLNAGIEEDEMKIKESDLPF
ncbi:MAG TPA: single-stranded DNA-binding protein [Candidatus Paceibacterota bacterium]|nr:single-stranded DNA-binding protein [Candidatus Paceibacterota bacterium]